MSDSDDLDCDQDGYPGFDEEFLDMDYESDQIPEEPEVDIEAYHFECLTLDGVDRLLATAVTNLMAELMPKDAGFARMLLHHFDWDPQLALQLYKNDPVRALALARARSSTISSDIDSNVQVCPTCFQDVRHEEAQSLDCGHRFCAECWAAFLECQIDQGHSTEIACMHQGCEIVAPMEFVGQLITPRNPTLADRFLQFSRNSWISKHPQLRYCPGKNCQAVIKVEKILARRVKCSFCLTQFCCQCGSDYHAPSDCETFRKWQRKLVTDAEIANYLVLNTKDCPSCMVCIEKNGGCNHMQCSRCKHDFCWLCLGNWNDPRSHKCGTYKENPDITAQTPIVKEREAFKKYLFYYNRWANHAKSLQLEELTRRRIQAQIDKKVMAKEGTWIDWQYLIDAAELLARCRYTLQYTYPFAFYEETGPRKSIFEFQQAALEREIENLSWNLERAETTHRGELARQMVKVGAQRKALLTEFFSF